MGNLKRIRTDSSGQVVIGSFPGITAETIVVAAGRVRGDVLEVVGELIQNSRIDLPSGQVREGALNLVVAAVEIGDDRAVLTHRGLAPSWLAELWTEVDKVVEGGHLCIARGRCR